MSVKVAMPEKQESGLGKVTQVFQMAMQAKNMMKGNQGAQHETDAVSRRLKKMDEPKSAPIGGY